MTSIQRISFDFPNTQRISVFHLAPGQTEYEDGKQRGTNASLSPPSVGQSGLCKQGSASSGRYRNCGSVAKVTVCERERTRLFPGSPGFTFQLSLPALSLLPHLAISNSAAPPPQTSLQCMCNHVTGLWPFTLCVCDLWRVIPHDPFPFFSSRSSTFLVL